MNRADRITFVVSYVLVVLSIAALGWFVQREMDQAREDRCAALTLQFELSFAQLGIAAASLPDNGETLADLQSSFDETFSELDLGNLNEWCPALAGLDQPAG